jgi:hypothetical protein
MKIKKTIVLLALGVWIPLAARTARAAFENPLVSPQATAMGGASLGSQGDSSTLFLNPAGVSGLKRPEAYFTYSQLYPGLGGVGAIGQGFVSAGVPTKLGTLAFGLGDFQAAGLLQERVVGLTFARRLFGSVDAGVTGKYLYHSYLTGSDPSAAADPVFRNGNSRGALALDAGFAAPLSDALRVGLAVRNINAPDVGLASVDRVPREYQAGLAYGIRAWALKLTADYVYRDSADLALQDRGLPAVGIEKGFERDMVLFRAGANPNQISAGVGIQFGSFGFDYAFLLDRALLSSAASAGTHQIGLRYKFGVSPEDARGH